MFHERFILLRVFRNSCPGSCNIRELVTTPTFDNDTTNCHRSRGPPIEQRNLSSVGKMTPMAPTVPPSYWRTHRNSPDLGGPREVTSTEFPGDGYQSTRTEIRRSDLLGRKGNESKVRRKRRRLRFRTRDVIRVIIDIKQILIMIKRFHVNFNVTNDLFVLLFYCIKCPSIPRLTNVRWGNVPLITVLSVSPVNIIMSTLITTHKSRFVTSIYNLSFWNPFLVCCFISPIPLMFSYSFKN